MKSGVDASLSQREPGKLLSQVIPNPNEGHKTAKAITLRSGNKVEKDDNEERNSTKNVAAPSPKLTVPSDNSKEHETVALSEEVSAVLLLKLAPKLKDPESFTIPCLIGSQRFEYALLDKEKHGKPMSVIMMGAPESCKFTFCEHVMRSSTRSWIQ
ncbi:hypothetical protein GBA52_026118 [Prunus armeniaca]|nr:hypothetical protein GBA52_026118 [Prunus armeniaca]